MYNPKAYAVLLHKRDAKAKINPNKWAFFGGLSEGGETPKQTFAREMSEELGVALGVEAIQPLADYFNEELKTHRYVFFAESEVESSQVRLAEGETFAWIPLEEVFTYDLTEKTRRDLNTFLLQKRM